MIDQLSIYITELLSADYSDAWERVAQVISNPGSDPLIALLVFGILSLLVATVLLVGIMFVLRASDDDDDGSRATDLPHDHSVAEESQEPKAPAAMITRPPKTPALTATFSILAVLLVWAALGLGSSSDAACQGCHSVQAHPAEAGVAEAGAANPHESLGCVDCHEPASRVGRYGTSTLGRSAHLLYGFGLLRADEYGAASRRACLNCHSAIATQTVKNSATGVAMSHKEPLEAGARCVDCHGLRQGMIQAGPSGMTRCVRCHNGKDAPSECESCHFKDISFAASAPQSIETTQGRAIIETPDCGGCHEQASSCDPCHGIRLPHSQAFRRGGHARQAVESYWYGDGKGCVKCHTETRRPCGTCHQGSFWSHSKSWAVAHQSADPNTNGCDSCHSGTLGTLPGRNFCIDLCHADREGWRRTN